MITEIIARLKAHGIRPSQQRLAIMSQLDGNTTHPTVDDIFSALRTKMPTLSRTTVYTTMKSFARQGLLCEVRTDDGELRYDSRTHFHAHFKCRVCGGVFDLELPAPHRHLYVSMPKGFIEEDEQLNYYGLCPKCSDTKKKKEG